MDFIRKLLGKNKSTLKIIDKTLYQPLINVLTQIHIYSEQEEKLRMEREEEEYRQYTKQYFEENRGEEAVSLLLKELGNNSQGEIDQTLELINDDNEPEVYNLKAYVTDTERLDILKEYADDARKFRNYEGYEFDFQIDPDLSQIKVPNCDCSPYEISDTFTVNGNCIDSNCDTWGTDCNAKAESLYVFLVKEINKLVLVKVRYWVV